MGEREKIAQIIMRELEENTMSIVDLADRILLLFPQWISVKDRLPEDGIIVLWWNADHRMIEFGSAGSFTGENITHWQALPQPPREEK